MVKTKKATYVLTQVSFVLAFGFFSSASSAADVDYLRDIKPVLRTKCYSCHGAIRQEGNLRLDTVALMRQGGDSGPALAKNGLQSLLWHRVTANADERMPPEGEPLSPEQRQLLRTWLDQGMPSPRAEEPQADPRSHWAFQPLSHIDMPPDSHPVDYFIDGRLRKGGLKRARQTSAISLIRRMFLDLHGLPPSPAQIDHWTGRLQKADSHQRVTAELINELLDSPRYGERWGQHWLDIVRYADTHGYEVNTPRPNAWPYRDYVIAAFNNDTPYNQFVLEQLAGDTVQQDAATGFLVAAAALLPGQIGADDESKRLARQDELDEIIVGTTATFMGLTVGCARCHDHKFDPIPQTDYYAMQAFFSGVRYGERAISADRSERQQRADLLQPKIDFLKDELRQFEPKAFVGTTIIIDDEDSDRVTLLAKKNGHGVNPAGTGRGYAGDVGDATRFGNLSRNRYTWWDNVPGRDVMTWNPGVSGQFRLWVSWGVHGSGVHTRDARYVLDRDGDLSTKDDQTQIAIADQYYFSGQTKGESEKKPLWSGLLDTGVQDFLPESKIILRGGETGTGITADVVVLQQPHMATDDHLPQLRGPVSAQHNVERLNPVDAKFLRFTTFATNENNRYQPCLDELEVFTDGPNGANIALADTGTVPTSSGNYSETGIHQLKHIHDGQYGNSHSWISSEFGKGWVQLEFPKVHTISRIEWARDREGKFADRLPVNYEISTSLDGRNWQTVASSSDRLTPGTPHSGRMAVLRNGSSVDEKTLNSLADQLTKLEKQKTELLTPRQVFAGKFTKPARTFVLNRGDPEQPTDEISPHVLTSLSKLSLPADAPDTQRRVTLANWLTSPDHPLTARVIVNRIWQYHFGIGLVDTPSDFGLNGSTPTHPQLLDWLATDFIRNGWSLKHVHRVIMSSATYQQASSRAAHPSQILTKAQSTDASNRLYWHFSSRRLEAESIRDCLLSVSGRLNLKMGGPGFNFFKSRGGLSGFPPVEEFTADELRRMIYAHKIRMERVPVFGAFDCPDAGLPTPRRSRSTTAIQALNLFNSPFVIDQSTAFAGRLRREAVSPEDQITLAFRLALGRPPTPKERTVVSHSVAQHGLETLCRALFNSSEFLFIP